MCEAIQAPAERAGLFEYINNLQTSKEETALAQARRQGRREGLVAVLSCVEPCQTMQVRGNPKTNRRAEISQTINERYVAWLANVAETTPLAELTKDLGRRRNWQGRSVRPLNPLAPEDVALLEALGHGQDAINGFRNRDLRQRLFGDAPAAERKRQAAKVTRLLRLLRGHHLIAKAPKTHRYQMTEHGRQCVAALLSARHAATQELLQAA